MAKAVFVGCARSCAPFLDKVLANVEALGSVYDSFELVVVENDSADDTRERLQTYARTRPNVRLIEADGLAASHPKRTDRIAAARNLYMQAVREPRYAECDDLVMLDFDDVNARPISVEAFREAREWLWAAPERRAVFANSAPFYYDIWALRRDGWSPDDCWVRVRAAEAIVPREEAVRRIVAARQIMISPTAAPILVESAFGGLGIYRREAALEVTYSGLDAAGEEVCEHVAANAAIRGEDGIMAIFPALQTQCPEEHVLGALGEATELRLEQLGRQCTLVAPPDHPLAGFRAAHPLYDRRLPELARIVSGAAPDEAFIDIGANVGDSIALARLAGARMPAIAIEASLTYCKYLWANMRRSPRLFANTRMVRGFAGSDGDGEVRLEAGSGSAAAAGAKGSVERAPGVRLASLVRKAGVSLVKTDTDGFDQDIVEAELAFLRDKTPILWLEAQTMSAADEGKWRELFASMAGEWPLLMIFDNFGFAIASGQTETLGGHAVELMAYARRQRERAGFKPTFYYLDIALFPTRFEGVYEAFRPSVPELAS